MELQDKREERRKRRKKNQIVAYTTLILGLVAVITTVFFLVYAIKNTMGNEFAINQDEEENIEETIPEESVLSEQETEEPDSEYFMTEVATEPESVEPAQSDEELLEELVETCISQMTLEEKVAGLFVITPEALTGVGTAIKAGDGTKEALEKYPVGGLIYFKKNIQSEEQITEMLSKTREMSRFPIFLCVDEEGGSVARLQDALGLKKTPDMAEIGATQDATKAYDAYANIGSYLTKYGFDVDFAPVADVLTNESNTAIKKRSFGSDADLVSTMIAASVKGLEEKGVTACLKHFPGQGNADGDTHSVLASTDRTLDDMRAVELKPFAAGIEAGAQMIMVGHFSAPEVTGDNMPATMSKVIITDILREEMGYDGVVITDALNMSAISDYYTSGEACIMALKSGADMVLMPEDFESAYEAVVEAVKDGTISEERINDSLKRVYRIKYASTLDNE